MCTWLDAVCWVNSRCLKAEHSEAISLSITTKARAKELQVEAERRREELVKLFASYSSDAAPKQKDPW